MYALTAKGARYMDEYTMSKGVPSAVLMENAAKGIVDEITEKFPERETSVLVLCGSGNNGGDAVCAARWLLHLGYRVCVYFTGDPDRMSSEFSRQVSIMRGMYPDERIYGTRRGDASAALSPEYDVIIDGMFGTGMNRRLGDNYVRFIDYINGKKSFRLAIDVPSGLNATTGLAMGAVIKADETVTFGSYKTGMFFCDGREACGDVKLVDIGIDSGGYRKVGDKLFICDEKFLEDTADMALKARPEKSHKGTFGTVGIVVGPDSMMGASILAARSAYRSGCGLVKILCPQKYVGFFNVSVPEVVAVPYRDEDLPKDMSTFLRGIDTVLIGPGLREDDNGRLLVKMVLGQSEVPAVIDAGALNLISKCRKSFKKRKCRCVITPHVGEMAKLCREEIDVVDKNRIGFIKRFSEKYNVSMVVKSDVSLVSLLNRDGEQRLFLNTTGNSGLATAGSGDVLAGLIASLNAQGNSLNNSLLYGVMIHGRAANRFGSDENAKRKMMAGDIIDNLF